MIVAIIPAQGTSRRLPEKNMKKIVGHPLLYWAIEAARRSKKIDKIIVSTDDERIAEYAESQNVLVAMRRKELCGDAPVVEVYKDVVKRSGLRDITHVVAIQPDHPDRSVDIDAMIDLVLKKNIYDFITTDRSGVRHGSVHIMKSEEMLQDRISYTSGAWIDICTNIHTEEDLCRAEASMTRKIQPLRIGNFTLYEEGPTFIMVNAGADNHFTLMDAKTIIDHAKSAGSNAVTFHGRKNAEPVVDKSEKSRENRRVSMNLVEGIGSPGGFGFEDYKNIFEYCRERDIIFLGAPLDMEFTDFFEDFGVAAFNIAYNGPWDFPLMKYVASKGKPVVLTTRTSSQEETRNAVNQILATGNRDIVILLCLTANPNELEDASLRQIQTLKTCCPDVIVGVSDQSHSDESAIIPSIAVALGAKVVEKPFTPHNLKTAEEHSSFPDANDLRRVVQNIRNVEKALGPIDS